MRLCRFACLLLHFSSPPLPSSFQLLYSFHSIDIVVRDSYILSFVTRIVCCSSPTLKSPKKPTAITHELLTHAHRVSRDKLLHKHAEYFKKPDSSVTRS
mmetsp:Transcript_52646/g.77087  ORF Transcript_52646/g.77087 Transcript_52646/m.77087 type:complete len:99 (-) Transcript_52646:8-304(-)